MGQQVTVSIFLTAHIKVTTSVDQHPNKQAPYFRCGAVLERVMQWVSCLLTGFGEGRTQNCTISVTTTTKKIPSLAL